MTVSITIMAHPKRRQQANLLLAKLGGQNFVQCYITWDQQNDEWETGRRALLAGVGKADWHVVLQDDAILPANFYDHVTAALNAVPSKSLVSFYTGRAVPMPKRVGRAVTAAHFSQTSWLRGKLLYWGVCIAMPSEHLESLVEWADTEKAPYDTRIGMMYHGNMLPVWYSVPSLVDHDDNLGSLLPGHNEKPGRIAYDFIKGPMQWNDRVTDI
jgi:hypothetical protein